MKFCPYCGAEYTDDIISCPVDHYPVGASVPRPCFTIPFWLKSLMSWLAPPIRWYRSQPRKRKLKVAILSSLTLLAVYILSTAQYSYYPSFSGAGTVEISKAPLFDISMGPAMRRVGVRNQNGIKFFPGGYLEFPIYPGYHVGIRYFTPSWWRQYHPR